MVEMKSGVIGLISGELDELYDIDETVEKQTFDAREVLEVRQSYTNLSGEIMAYSGRAAIQEPSDEQTVNIDSNGEISTITNSSLTWKYTEFLFIPGEAVIVNSGNGIFIFDLIMRHFDTLVERAEVDLDEFSSANSVENTWKVGFYGRQGSAENGVFYGNDIMDDEEISHLIDGTTANQLGLQLKRDGKMMKITITESAYLDVYEPDNFDSAGFAEFIIAEILPASY